MKLLLVLLLCIVPLVACAPASDTRVIDTAAEFARGLGDPASFTLSAPDVGPPVIVFASGPWFARALRVEIGGSDLRVNAARFCRADAGLLACEVPEVPAGKNFVLAVTGSNLSALARYARPDGLWYRKLASSS